MGQALQVLGVVLIAAPLSIVITLLLFPFWSWLENATGIESVGHSGPAVWCYATVFLVVVTASGLLLFARKRKR